MRSCRQYQEQLSGYRRIGSTFFNAALGERAFVYTTTQSGSSLPIDLGDEAIELSPEPYYTQSLFKICK